MLILCAAVKAFFISSGGMDLSYFGAIIIVIFTSGMITDSLNGLLSSMKTGGNFLLSFIPIYTVIIALTGNVSSALTYNTVTFAYAQGLSGFINNYAIDIVGAYISVSIAFAFNKLVNLNRFIATVNKIVGTVVGFASGIFTALLSVRGILSTSVDSASAKSIKFLVSNLIPIVGSAISDAYSSLVGSISIIKGSIAALGIIVILIISIPPIIEGGVYCICFSLLSYIAEILGENLSSSILRAISTGIKTIVLLSVLQVFVLIISTGIMLSIKGV